MTCRRLSSAREPVPAPERARRTGVVVLELIVWLPVLVIFLLSIIEFGLIMQTNRQVAFASRFGASLASEISRLSSAPTNLSNYNMIATPDNLKLRVDEYLENHGLTPSCEVRLEHNACVGGQSQVQTMAACNCGPTGPAVLPAGEPPAGEAYVRVTVCVPLAGNVPDILDTFGFSLSTRTIEHSTTFRIETNNSTAQPSITAQSVDDSNTTNATVATSVALPATNTNFSIIVTDNGGVATGTVDVNFSGTAIDPEDGALTGGSLVWSVNPAPVNLNPVTGNGPITMTINVPASGNSVVYNVTLTSTDSCGATASRTVQVTITHP